MSFKIHCIDVKNALQNYIWLLEHEDSQDVIAIDPTEAGLVEQYCQAHQLNLAQIWLTHWHKHRSRVTRPDFNILYAVFHLRVCPAIFTTRCTVIFHLRYIPKYQILIR